MKKNADWFAWSLQFLVGFVVGGIFGFALMVRERNTRDLSRAFRLPFDQVLIFALGAALIGAALASYHGDRLWLGDSHRVIPPDGAPHNDASRTASIVTGGLGGVLILVVILRQLQVF